MNHNEKKDILKKLSEQQLRRDVLIPLLSKMGYRAPLEYHGVSEKGKDIICYSYNKLKEKDYLSLVVKKGGISGDVSSDRSLREMIYQVEQSFAIEYNDIYNMQKVHIHEVWIVTSGKITSGAQDSVIDYLRNNNLDRLVKVIADHRLVDLIDSYYPAYWLGTGETAESLKMQRDRIFSFIKSVMKQLGADSESVERVVSQLLLSDEIPLINQASSNHYITTNDYSSITINSINEEWSDDLYSHNCGGIKKQFANAKDSLKSVLYELEEVMMYGNEIMDIIDPVDFICEFENKLDGEYPFWNCSSHSKADECLSEVATLKDGVQDVIYFRETLKDKNLYNSYLELTKSCFNLSEEILRKLDTNVGNEILFQFGINNNQLFLIDEKNSINVLFSFKRNIETERKRNWNKTYIYRLTVEDVIGDGLIYLRDYFVKEHEFYEE